MLVGWLQRHQVYHVHESDTQIRKMLPQQSNRGKRLQRGNISRAGHDGDRRNIGLIIAGPVPEILISRGAVLRTWPPSCPDMLQRGLFAGHDHVGRNGMLRTVMVSHGEQQCSYVVAGR